jgi:hypothetical protein
MEHVMKDESEKRQSCLGFPKDFTDSFGCSDFGDVRAESKQAALVPVNHGMKVKKRVREFFTQTDTDAVEEWTQTDAYLMEDNKKKKKKRDKPTMKTAGTVDNSKKGGAMFADAESMKAQMREALIKPQYNVQDYYHERGFFQALACSTHFDQITLGVIFVNAIWIAVDTDLNGEAVLLKAHPVFQVAEHSFCSFFTAEVFIRFMAFRDKSRCLKDAWFVFDALLVTMMIAETWVMSIIFAVIGTADGSVMGNAGMLRMLRLARMIRISRMVRLLRAIPELVILIKGIGAASRSVCVFFLLWTVIIYVFAVIFRQLTEGQPSEDLYFSSVPAGMNTLLVDGLFPDVAGMVHAVSDDNPFFWFLMMFFIGLAALTVMYMLVGVLVDIVKVIATTEKEAMTVTMLASQLRGQFEALGRDVEAPITKYEFASLLAMPEITVIVQGVGVDAVILLEMADIIFDDPKRDADGGLTFQGFVECILNMRGSNPATVKDVKELVRVIKMIVHADTIEALKVLKSELAAIRADLFELKLDTREALGGDDDEEVEIENVGSDAGVAFLADSDALSSF